MDYSNVADAEFNDKYNGYQIIFNPKKLGIEDIRVAIYNGKTNTYHTADSITFTVVSYPDRSGWISMSNLDKYDYGLSCCDVSDETNTEVDIFYGSSYSDKEYSCIISDKYKISSNIYKNDGIRYKYLNSKFYFNTSDLENKFFK